ncbi:MAG: DUF2497 domain-containing protein [Alphaproteobacteria bacterium]
MSEEAKSEQEPSMDEILASIRRIISEDDTNEGKSDDSAAEEGVEENDEVLELTDVVEDEEPVEEAVSAEEDVVDDAEEEAPQSQDDIDSLFDEAESTNNDDEIEFVEEEAAEVPEEVVADPPVPVTAVLEGTLLDEAPATAATGSLSNLVATVDAAHGGTPLRDGNRTIEDLVKEVMRPMIKEWLDDNLPSLVERIVQREVERLARTAEGDE